VIEQCARGQWQRLSVHCDEMAPLFGVRQAGRDDRIGRSGASIPCGTRGATVARLPYRSNRHWGKSFRVRASGSLRLTAAFGLLSASRRLPRHRTAQTIPHERLHHRGPVFVPDQHREDLEGLHGPK
jgi:hypothetical protein